MATFAKDSSVHGHVWNNMIPTQYPKATEVTFYKFHDDPTHCYIEIKEGEKTVYSQKFTALELDNLVSIQL